MSQKKWSMTARLPRRLTWQAGAAGLLLLATAALTAPVSAQTWAEVGDAGDLPATAQAPSGSPGLTAITGTISSGSDADLFQIFLLGGPFSATTVGTPGTLGDTQLFLFDSAGMGLLGNDDAVGLRSTISSGSLPAGSYYLGITGFNRDPISAGGLIFPSTFSGQHGPTGPGGAQPLVAWSGGSSAGSYTIDLTGVTGVAATPEPGSMALLAAGALPLLRRLRRRAPAAGPTTAC
jgi:hypothetical protein